MSNYQVSLGQKVLFSEDGGGTVVGGAGIEPDICHGLYLKNIDGVNKLIWKDSGDTVVESQVLSTWKGTKLVRKEGTYPASPDDGELLEDNTVLNKYAYMPFEDKNVEGKDWKYRLFPYSASGVYSMNKQNCFDYATVYEFIIVKSESSPLIKIKYCGINEHFTPAHMDYDKDTFDYGSWGDTWVMKKFRPCILNHDKTVKCYLNPDNLAYDIDGNPSSHNDVTQDYEVMVEMDQIWVKDEILPNGDYHICLSNVQLDGYDCWTHYDKDNNLKEHYYIAKYLGQVYTNPTAKVLSVRSISGQIPTTSLSGITQRQYCQAHGDGWDCWEWSFVRVMQYLLLLISKTTDAQTAFGSGFYSGYTSLPSQANGQNDIKGQFYGKKNTNYTITTFYIDNFYAFAWHLTVGCVNNKGKWQVKMTPGNKDGSTTEDGYWMGSDSTEPTGYIDTKLSVPAATSSYIQDVTLVPGKGLFPTTTTGASATTYWCDAMWSDNSIYSPYRFGGAAHNGLVDRPLAVAVHYVASYSPWHYGVSLSCK